MSASTRLPVLRNIQILRGLAAVLVATGHILFEVGFRKTAAPLPFTGNALQFRFGVDTFFVISGFIMVYTTFSKPAAPGAGPRFLLARFLRLSPLYWTVTLLAFCLSLFASSAFNHHGTSIVRLMASLFYIPYRNADGDMFPIVGPGWTLEYEMFFYVLFALCLGLPRRMALWALIGALAVISSLAPVLGSHQPVLDFYANPILLEFAAGVGIGALALHGRLTGLSKFAGFALAAGCIWFIALHLIGYDDMRIRWFVYGIPAVLLAGSAIVYDLDRTGRGSESGPIIRFLTMLGDASYSIYLTHIFVVRLTRILLDRFVPGVPAPLFCAVCLGMVIVVGIIVAKGFEIPMHNLTRRFNRSFQRLPAAELAG